MHKTFEISQLLDNLSQQSKQILQLLNMNAANDKLEYFNPDWNR